MTTSRKTSTISSFVLISVYIIFLIILKTVFPTGADLIRQFSNIYSRYGYEIVFIGAMFESLVVINFFVPGVLAIGLGIIFARNGELNLEFTILAAILGSMVSYILDFVLGKFGFGQVIEKIGFGKTIEKVQKKVEKYGLKSFSLGFIHPDLGSLLSLTAGILKIPFEQFFILALLSTTVWFILWGILIFAMGGIFLTILTKYAFILFVFVLAIWILFFAYEETKKG